MAKTMYLPISETCSSGITLRELGVREVAYPFDWAGLPYQSIADAIDNGFDDAFIDYEKIYAEKYDCVIWEKKYNMLLIHEPDMRVELIKARYKRRYKRMIEDLKNSDEVFLIPSALNEETPYEFWNTLGFEFTEKIPTREELNLGNIENVKEAILRVNPNIKITFPKQYNTWDDIMKAIRKHKEC